MTSSERYLQEHGTVMSTMARMMCRPSEGGHLRAHGETGPSEGLDDGSWSFRRAVHGVAIVIAESVAVVSAAAGWTVGRALLGDELEQYRKADMWKAPDAIRRLTDVSGRLSVTRDERARLEEAVKAVEEMKAESERTVKELPECKRQVEGLQTRLRNVEGDTFFLEPGKTRCCPR